jgi:hypothetical protein
MKKLTQVELQQQGYQFQNAEISDVDTVIAEDGTLRTYLILSGNGWRIQYGGYAVGATNPSATEFQATAKGIELLMRLITLVGARSVNGLIGKYVRVAVLPEVGEVKIIGNIVEDKWFDIEDFFKPEEKVSEADPETPAEQSVPDAPSAPSMPDELQTANVPTEEQAEENK